MLTVTEPHIVNELLLDKNGIVAKDMQILKKSSPLVMIGGKEWVLYCRIVSPAFHHDKIKVSRSFMLPIISISFK